MPSFRIIIVKRRMGYHVTQHKYECRCIFRPEKKVPWNDPCISPSSSYASPSSILPRIFPSNRLAILFTWMLTVTAFVSYRHFEMIDTDQRRLGGGGEATVGRKGRYVSSVAIPTIHETSFCGFSAGEEIWTGCIAKGTGMGNSSRKSGKPRQPSSPPSMRLLCQLYQSV